MRIYAADVGGKKRGLEDSTNPPYLVRYS